MDEGWGRLHFWVTFIGVYAIFTPMHLLGVVGNPRRYSQFTEFDFLKPLMGVHEFITIAAFVTVAAQFVFLFNLFYSMRKGPLAEINPWKCTTLEWTVPAPPPHDNFEGRPPAVYHGAYEYSVPGVDEDYVMQTDPAPLPAARH
ncbi:MAG: cbb3-type cytochrome c oxidase subunit I, partial [Acidobacteria bacterium]|nr:cbb3-type cytochrome c oxidase subunit I [Acidobacteriota bacterium]